MATVLGVLGIAGYIAAMVSLSAGVTWIVVRVSPNPNKKKTT